MTSVCRACFRESPKHSDQEHMSARVGLPVVRRIDGGTRERPSSKSLLKSKNLTPTTDFQVFGSTGRKLRPLFSLLIKTKSDSAQAKTTGEVMHALLDALLSFASMPFTFWLMSAPPLHLSKFCSSNQSKSRRMSTLFCSLSVINHTTPANVLAPILRRTSDLLYEE